MKKINYFFAAAMICMTVAACVKEAGNDNPGVNSGNTTEETIPDNYIELSFQTPGMDVKTSVDENKVSWAAGDRIRICWDGGSSISNAVVFEDGNASFTAMVDPEATDFYAVYPSAIEASVTEGNFNVTIPSSQSGRFADADIIVAKTSKDNLAFAFHHAVSLVKFVISEENQKGISRAQFVDLANNSQLTGALSIAFDESNAIASSTVTEDTTLDVIDVTAVQPGDNYMAVLPSKSLAGFGLRLGSESKWYSGLVSESPVVVERLPLGTVDTKIHEGDFYIKPDGEGKGTSWEDAGDADFLKSLIHNTQYNGVKNLAKAWRLDGKTIKIAVGEYSAPGADGFTCAMGDISFTVDGGYTGEGDAKSQTDATIIGSNTADTEKRAFFFYNMKDVTLTNLKMKHNSTTYSGGAMYVVGTGLTLQNCIFENNKAGNNGGAIARTDGGSDLIISNSCFMNNTATNSGGAIYTAETPVTLHQCVFNSNTSKYGAAVQNGGLLKADQCKIINNYCTVKQLNGVIHLKADAYFNSCEFRGNYNTQTNAGNVLYTTTNKVAYNNCLFHNNKKSTDTTAPNSWIIYTTQPLIMVNSTMIENCNVCAMECRNASAVCINSVVINNNTSATSYGLRTNAAKYIFTSEYNLVSSYNVQTQGKYDKICSSLPSGAANTYDTTDSGMSYYSWSGSIDGFTKTTTGALKTYIESSDFGKAFYSWLDELVEGDGTALDYDIRGEARTNGYWPGSYQNN